MPFRFMNCRFLSGQICFLVLSLALILPNGACGADSNASAADRHARAMNAEKSGDLRKAVELEQQAVHLAPNNEIFRGELSRLLWNLGFVDKAMSECSEALKSNPANWKNRFNLAVMLQSTGDTKAAISEYEKVLKSNSSSTAPPPLSILQARLGLLQSFALSGKSQEAVNQIDALAAEKKRFPEFMIDVADTAIKINQPRRAKNVLRDFAASSNMRAISLLYLAAARSDDEKLAVSIQKKVLDAGPKDPRIYFIAARLADDKGDIAAQEQILEHAMKAIRNDGNLYLRLAGLHMARFEQCRAAGDEKTAQAWLGLADKTLDFAEGLQVKGWICRFAHAGVYALQGRHNEAASIIEELAKREPKNELILYCRGRMRGSGNNPAAAAKRQLQNLFKESSESAGASKPQAESIELACSRAHFANLSCGCHTGVLEFKWKRSGGVLFAKIISERPAVGLIVHQLGDLAGYKSRIISAAASLNERLSRVETKTVKGLGALSMCVADPEAQAEPPLSVQLSPPELQRL